MSKKNILLEISVIMILSILLSTISFANSGENITENYIGSYEDYENLFSEAGSQYSQDDLKHGYEEYQKEIRAYYSAYQRDDLVKAKVVETLAVKDYYDVDEYYYSISKYEIQPITVKILEGEDKGELFSFEYLLTGDSLNNLRYAELQEGDVIFVSIKTNEETGEVYADITNAGSNVDRFALVLCIGVIALVLMMIYGGKKGIITALMVILILDFCLIIIPNMGFLGAGFIVGGIVLITLLVICTTFIKFGINRKSLKAIGISILMILVSWLLLMVGNYLTRTVGITFEVAAVSENVIMGNMDFGSLYIIITMIIVALYITNIVCKTILTLDNSDAKSFSEKLKACQSILGTNVLYVTLTIMALYIPNHLLLITNKYNSLELWNAEILVSELIRLFIIIISMSLTIPTVVALDDKE